MSERERRVERMDEHLAQAKPTEPSDLVTQDAREVIAALNAVGHATAALAEGVRALLTPEPRSGQFRDFTPDDDRP